MLSGCMYLEDTVDVLARHVLKRSLDSGDHRCVTNACGMLVKDFSDASCHSFPESMGRMVFGPSTTVASLPFRYLVGVSGPPGGGKSTIAALVTDRANQLAAIGDSTLGAAAVMVPMDGFHYYRKELDAMDDPKEAHARRGAHWTFNATVRFPISMDPPHPANGGQTTADGHYPWHTGVCGLHSVAGSQ